MNLFEWLEASRVALWVSESFWGYPLMISMHAIGLAILAGTLIMVNLRLLGAFSGLPTQSLSGLINMAWVGLAINLISGVSLFSSQATVFIENTPFLIKIPAILAAVTLAGVIQHKLRLHAVYRKQGEPIASSIRAMAALSILLWLMAIVSGRLTAYF